MPKTKLIAVAVSALGYAPLANAAITWDAQPGLGTSPAAINFDAPLPAGWSMSFTGDGGLRTGTGPGEYVAPEGDGTQYASSGIGSVALTSMLPQRAVQLDWSSVDLYNTFQLFDGSTLVGSLTGGQISPNAASDVYRPTYHVDVIADQDWNTIVASSTQNALELDNVNPQAASNVPEPGTLGIMGVMLAGMAFVTRKRSAAHR